MKRGFPCLPSPTRRENNNSGNEKVVKFSLGKTTVEISPLPFILFGLDLIKETRIITTTTNTPEFPEIVRDRKNVCRKASLGVLKTTFVESRGVVAELCCFSLGGWKK